MVTRDSTHPTFLLVGNGPYENRGCEAIVRGTIEILTRRYQDARFLLCSFGHAAADDAEAETDHRIEHRPGAWKPRSLADPRWWAYKVLLRPFPSVAYRYDYQIQRMALEESACALSVGGDNYSLDYGPPLQFVHLDEVLLPLGRPVVLWGASVGPFTQDCHIERLMARHLRRLSLVLVRESETCAYLESIGVSENVRTVADPAFAMPAEQPALSPELMDFVAAHPVGINLSPLIGRYVDPSDGWPELAAECLGAIVKYDGYPILLVPHVMQAGNDDYAFMLKAAEPLLRMTDRIRILPPRLTASEYKWVISQTRAFVGARTHATIAALSTCVPTVSIGYSMKAKGLNMDTLGSLDWLVNARSLSPEYLVERIQNALRSEDGIRAHLASTVPTMLQRAHSAAHHVAQVVR